MWMQPAAKLKSSRRSERQKPDTGVTTMPAYDTNNIFAKIIRGELPCYKIYEDDRSLVSPMSSRWRSA